MSVRSVFLSVGVVLWVLGYLAAFTFIGFVLFLIGSIALIVGLALFVRDRWLFSVGLLLVGSLAWLMPAALIGGVASGSSGHDPAHHAGVCAR